MPVGGEGEGILSPPNRKTIPPGGKFMYYRHTWAPPKPMGIPPLPMCDYRLPQARFCLGGGKIWLFWVLSPLPLPGWRFGKPPPPQRLENRPPPGKFLGPPRPPDPWACMCWGIWGTLLRSPMYSQNGCIQKNFLNNGCISGNLFFKMGASSPFFTEFRKRIFLSFKTSLRVKGFCAQETKTSRGTPQQRHFSRRRFHCCCVPWWCKFRCYPPKVV